MEPPTAVEARFQPHLRASEVKRGLDAERLLQGDFLMVRNTCFCGMVTCGFEQILISGSEALNRAVDGDTVVVERIDREQQEAYDVQSGRLRHRSDGKGSQKRSEADEVERALFAQERAGLVGVTRGRVVSIVKRSKRMLVGSILGPGDGPDVLEDSQRFFVGSDKRFPFVVLKSLPEGFDDEYFSDKRVAVALDVWDRFSEYPSGHWTGTFGKCGDINVETQLILHENSVKDEPFTDEVIQCLPSADFQPSAKDLEGREDFRDVCVFSIDPPGCEDVDDALSCEPLENGNFRIGVHIADVSHFVKPNTAIDKEAADRCTSVYLVDRRIDMLPRLLTTDICSLRFDGKLRLTFSFLCEMTPGGDVLDPRFCKGVIRSRGALAYAEAQKCLDGDPDDIDENIRVSVRHLNKLAVQLRAVRMEAGALELESDEVQFERDEETKLPTNLFQYQSYAANKLIEEFMLMANRYAALRISSFYPGYAVLRNHRPPRNELIEDLKELLRCHGIFDFETTSNKVLGESLAKLVKKGDPFFNRLVRIMTTRCMQEALYVCTGTCKESTWSHYGLAMSHYTHFTSPIRRYADCIVHRFLAASLDIEPLPKEMKSEMNITAQVTAINHRHKMAQWSDRASVDLHRFLYFKAQGAVIAEGIVMRVKEGRRADDPHEAPGPSTLQVAVEEYGCEGEMELEARDWRVFGQKHSVMGRPLSPYQGVTIDIFDRIVVKVEANMDDGRHRSLKITFVALAPANKKAASPAAEVSRDAGGPAAAESVSAL